MVHGEDFKRKIIQAKNLFKNYTIGFTIATPKRIADFLGNRSQLSMNFSLVPFKSGNFTTEKRYMGLNIGVSQMPIQIKIVNPRLKKVLTVKHVSQKLKG